ncbi:MAG TPA: hypothetical protein VGQ83_03225 [Polyangia bacterium]|jgi:hypothetical protein
MDRRDPTRELVTIEEYVALSAKINYQLSARAINRPALLALVLGDAELEDEERALLLKAVEVLQAGYHEDRRRLGTPGILHPLRTATLLCRALRNPSLVHLLCALLHDKDEDLTEGEVGPERWARMQDGYAELLAGLGPARASEVEVGVRLLSNLGAPTYEAYLGRLLDGARTRHDLLHVKLADRLDNTFDICLQHPGVTKYNFYRAVFDILFLPRFSGVQMGSFHFMPETDEGVMLLSQLFKDLTFLAILREEKLDTLDKTTRRLFTGLAVAGIREAQWLALESFNTWITDPVVQRALLKDLMAYSSSGGIEVVTPKEAGGQLDGMLLSTFKAQQEGHRKKMLRALFDDHELLTRMVLTFIVVFAAFINDPHYTIKGITRTGMEPGAA